MCVCSPDVYLCAVLICSVGLVCMCMFTVTVTCQYIQRKQRLKGLFQPASHHPVLLSPSPSLFLSIYLSLSLPLFPSVSFKLSLYLSLPHTHTHTDTKTHKHDVHYTVRGLCCSLIGRPLPSGQESSEQVSITQRHYLTLLEVGMHQCLNSVVVATPHPPCTHTLSLCFCLSLQFGGDRHQCDFCVACSA